MAYNTRWYRLAGVNRTHARYTSNGVFNNNFDFPFNSRNKKKSRVIAYVHSCVFRVELDESQCKCVESVHSNGKFSCAS